MNIADYILIGFVALMLFIGFYKGFAKMAISFLSGIVSFVVALYLATPLANLIDSWKVFDPAKEKIQNFFESGATYTTDNVQQTIEGISAPDFIKNILLSSFADKNEPIDSAVTMLTDKVFNLMLLGIAFIAILIILRIAFFFIEKIIVVTVSKVKVLNMTNRILGGAFSLLQAALLVYIILGIIALMSSGMLDTVDTISESLIVSKLYNNNILMKIFL